jgi:tetratricopeptide (TPR) repeat protein
MMHDMTPDQIQTLSALGYFYLSQGFPDRALIIYKGLNQLAPGQISTLRALALSHVQLKQPINAMAMLDQLALKGVTDATYHLLRSQVLMSLQRAEEAQAAMRAYINAREIDLKVAA